MYPKLKYCMPFVQCSYCTGAAVKSSIYPESFCIECKSIVLHVCTGCSVEHDSNVKLCHLCIPRPKKSSCYCDSSKKGNVRRFKVNKRSRNYGRYFYSCRVCGFFDWE